MAKIKFRKVEGCTAYSKWVGEQDLNDISQEQINVLKKYLCAEILKREEITLFDLVELFEEEEYNDLGKCDQCGDFVSEWIWEI